MTQVVFTVHQFVSIVQQFNGFCLRMTFRSIPAMLFVRCFVLAQTKIPFHCSLHENLGVCGICVCNFPAITRHRRTKHCIHLLAKMSFAPPQQGQRRESKNCQNKLRRSVLNHLQRSILIATIQIQESRERHFKERSI